MKRNFFLTAFKILLVLSIFLIYSCGSKSANQETIKLSLPDNNPDSTVKVANYFFDELLDTSFYIEPKSNGDSRFNNLNFDSDEFNPDGIFTFRGGNLRNSPVRGELNYSPKKILRSWEFKTAQDSMSGKWGTWGGGAGWTGQPLVVNWKEEEIKSIDALKPEFKSRKSLKEIIQVSLSGRVYFIEFETGKATRAPLYIKNPIKGTPSIDCKNKEFLMVGQGVPHRGGFAWRCFDLKNNKLIHEEKMPNDFAYRSWGACDASPLIDYKTKNFIWPTESGVIYRGVLGTEKIDSISMFRYKSKDTKHQGLESSPSAIGNLAYFTDNGGNIFCLDVRTMKARWHYFNKDDSDASPAIQLKEGVPYIFVGNEVDKQGGEGIGALRKLNGLTGKLEWQYEKKCYSVTSPKTNNGGMLSTPCIGRNKAEHLVWTIFSRTPKGGKGVFVCLNINTGQLVYEIPLDNYSWVSPIALYDKSGNPYVYFPDVYGNVYLVDGLSGKIIYKEAMGYTFESSPIAWGNRIIQPARGNKICSFLIE
ncbi:MAG: hypothetical protein ACK5D5_12105 [Bacteroidota bacterium]